MATISVEPARVSSPLRLSRERVGLSQSELATIAGVSRSTVTRLENGVTTVSPSLVRVVAAFHAFRYLPRPVDPEEG